MYRAWVADIMATAQQQLAAKLAVCSADGTRVHGNLIETYESEGEPVIRVLDKKTFICECWCRQTNQSTRHAASLPNDSVLLCCVICPWCGRSPMPVVVTRQCGNSYNNLLKHMGTKDHWRNHQRHAHGISSFDKAAWVTYTAGNHYGPTRYNRTAQHAKRMAKRDAVVVAMNAASKAARTPMPTQGQGGTPGTVAVMPAVGGTEEPLPFVELPSEALEHVRITQAEYLSVVMERADAGFSTLAEACCY